jgi:hypothetical protein
MTDFLNVKIVDGLFGCKINPQYGTEPFSNKFDVEWWSGELHEAIEGDNRVQIFRYYTLSDMGKKIR